MVEYMQSADESCAAMPEGVGKGSDTILFYGGSGIPGVERVVTWRSLHCDTLGFYSPAITPLSVFAIIFIMLFAWQISKKRKVSQ